MQGGTNAGASAREKKEVTAGTEQITVAPSKGKLLEEVKINPTPSQTKTVTAGTGNVNVFPDSGKLLSKVTVKPTPVQEKIITPSTSQQTVVPDSGKHLSKVTVEKVPDSLKRGKYTWSERNSDFEPIGHVSSDTENAFPNGGWQGGKYYERFAGFVETMSFQVIEAEKNQSPGKIIFFGGKFIGMNNARYSADGRTWSAPTTSPEIDSTSRLEIKLKTDSILIGLATGTKGNLGIYYSVDGTSWVQSNITTNYGTYIAYDKNKNIYFLGRIESNGRPFTFYVYYSLNGKTWTMLCSKTANESARFGVFDVLNDLFLVSISGDCTYYFTDNKNLEQITGYGYDFSSCLYGNGKYVAIGNRPKTTSYYYADLYYSTDGKSWTVDRYLGQATQSLLYFDDVNQLFYIRESNAGRYSIDGLTWTAIPYLPTFPPIVRTPDILLTRITNVSDSNVIYTIDGKTWEQLTKRANSGGCIACDDGLLIASFYNDNYLSYSLDGINWEKLNLAFFTNKIAYASTYVSNCKSNWFAYINDYLYRSR